jgi:hypothetical protein
MFNARARFAHMEILMLQLERNSDTLLLKQRLKTLEGCRKRKLINCLRGAGRDASLASLFFGAELKTWRGEQPLWLTFWIYGAGVSGFLAILYGVAVYAATPAFEQILLIVLGAYTVWVLISLWRCTERAKPYLG